MLLACLLSLWTWYRNKFKFIWRHDHSTNETWTVCIRLQYHYSFSFDITNKNLFAKFGVYFRYIYLCFAFVTICSACDKRVSQCLFYFFFFFWDVWPRNCLLYHHVITSQSHVDCRVHTSTCSQANHVQLEKDSSWNPIQSPNNIFFCFFLVMSTQTEVRLRNTRSIALLERIGNLDESSVLCNSAETW